MKKRALMVLAICHAVFGSLAQKPASYSLESHSRRIPIQVDFNQTLVIQLSELIPGDLYFMTGIHAPVTCFDDLEITVDSIKIGAGGSFVPKKTTALVTVTNHCSTNQIWLSVSNKYKPSPTGNKSNNILLGVNVTPEKMIREHLVGGDCYEISNVTYSGSARNRGIFANGETAIGIKEGIMLGTGDLPIVVPGPNLAPNATRGDVNQIVFDADLNQIYDSTFDIARLEFDFIPTSTTISFRFVFASEEYCEFINSPFKDVFGFFISGPGITGTQNMAKVPVVGIPISISTINHINNAAYYVPNIPDTSSQLVQDACIGHPSGNPTRMQRCQFDGMTTILTASATVIPCQKYHLKMAIADVADALYDSAVFFEESSFDAGGSVLASVVYPNNGTVAYEGCAPTYLRFVRELGDRNLTIPIPLNTGGTATVGQDYQALPDTVYLTGGVDTLWIPINVLSDELNEGLETIVFNIPNACKCSDQVISVLIQDQVPLEGSLTGGKICFGETFLLQPVVNGGIAPLSYKWSNGDTAPGVSLGLAGTYTVTVTDFCGQQLVLSSALEVTLPINLVVTSEQVALSDTFEIKATTTLPSALIASAGWSPGNHLSCAACPTTLAWPPLKTIYTYTITTTEGCTATAQLIIAGKGSLNVFVPNVFSPNFDNINDKFWIFGRSEDVRAVRRFAVFDRWGNKVFENGRSQVNDVPSGWDGTFRGKEQAPAVFGWVAEIEAYNGEIFIYEGDVTLIR